MANDVFQCPFCRGKFRLPADLASEQILCPHCSQVVELPKSASRRPAGTSAAANTSPGQRTDSIVTKCPTCSGTFQVLATMLEKSVACPHCRSRLQIVAPGSASNVPSGDSQYLPPAPGPDVPVPKPRTKPAQVPTPDPAKAPIGAATTSNPSPSAQKPIEPAQRVAETPPLQTPEKDNSLASELDPELAELLPPKFLAPGQTRTALNAAEDTRIVLPDAQGGFQTIDASVRQVSYAGQTIAIAALPETTKRRRRRIRSLVIFTICAIVLLVTFYYLSR